MLYVKILGIFARTCKDFIAFFVGLIGLLGSIHRHILRRSACISYPSGALRFEGSPAWEWRLLVAQTSHLLRPHTKICLCGVQYAKCPAQPQNAFFSPLRPESFEAQKNKKHGEHTILTDQHHFRILKWWLPTNLQMMILEVGIFQSISWFHFPTSSSFTSTWPHVRNPQSIAMCMYEDYEVYMKSILLTYIVKWKNIDFVHVSFRVLSVTVFGSSSRNRRATRPLRVCCASTASTVAPAASTGTRKSWGWIA